LAQYELSEDDYLNVGNRNEYDGFSEAERDALEYAEKFAVDHLSIDQEFMDRMVGHFGEELVVEMTLAIGCWIAFGRLNQVMDVVVSCPLRMKGPDEAREALEASNGDLLATRSARFA
jgi:alkylhydroperoxidase family enzyme